MPRGVNLRCRRLEHGRNRTLRLSTLKKRSEFLRIRGGSRWSSAAFVLEMKPRQAMPEPQAVSSGRGVNEPAALGSKNDDAPRFGLTVTKKMGTAVTRNKIRRRLKAAIAATPAEFARPSCDYVIIARRGALTMPFEELRKTLEQGLKRVHQGSKSRRKESSRRQAGRRNLD